MIPLWPGGAPPPGAGQPSIHPAAAPIARDEGQAAAAMRTVSAWSTPWSQSTTSPQAFLATSSAKMPATVGANQPYASGPAAAAPPPPSDMAAKEASEIFGSASYQKPVRTQGASDGLGGAARRSAVGYRNERKVRLPPNSPSSDSWMKSTRIASRGGVPG